MTFHPFVRSRFTALLCMLVLATPARGWAHPADAPAVERSSPAAEPQSQADRLRFPEIGTYVSLTLRRDSSLQAPLLRGALKEISTGRLVLATGPETTQEIGIDRIESVRVVTGDRIGAKTWGQLTELRGRHWVALTVPTGVAVEGLVVALRPDALIVDVVNSSDPRRQPAGHLFVARESVSALWLRRHAGAPGKAAAVAALTVLAGIGLWAMASIAVNETGDGGALQVLGLGGGIGLGALAGWGIGRQKPRGEWTPVTVVLEQRSGGR